MALKSSASDADGRQPRNTSADWLAEFAAMARVLGSAAEEGWPSFPRPAPRNGRVARHTLENTDRSWFLGVVEARKGQWGRMSGVINQLQTPTRVNSPAQVRRGRIDYLVDL